MIKIKRAYEPAEPADGYRVLVDRLWPRGVKKETLALDEWAKDIAPSNQLRRKFAHDERNWRSFRSRYKAELQRPSLREAIADLARRARRDTVTLVYSARDEEHNNAVVLKGLLARGSPPRAGRSAAAPPQTRRARAAMMKIHVHSRRPALGSADRAEIQLRVGRKLSKYASRIERVTVRLDDVNGPRAGVDKLCRMKIVLAGQPSIVTEARGRTPNAAVDQAAAAAALSLGHSLERRQRIARKAA